MSSTVRIVGVTPGPDPKPQMMGLRLAENFFQRWFLLAIPVLIMGSVGVLMAQRVTSSYVGSATLSTSANPLVGAQEIRGLSATFRESPASATARVMNERLATDRFASNVAARAGLAEAIDNGFLSYDDLRSRVSIYAIGESLVDIDVVWSDPATTVTIIDATIAQFQTVLQSTVAADAQQAVDFYESRRAEAVVTADEAVEAYETFTAGLGFQLDGDELAVTDELELRRLNDRLVAAQAAIDVADANIEEARLSVVRAQSEAGGSIEIVDPAEAPFEPESTLMDQITFFGVFLFLGLLVSLTILLLSTYLDRSVRSAADIEEAGGGITVATVPIVKSLRPQTPVRKALGRVGQATGRMLGRGGEAA